jgi:hypothetical protein
MFLVINWVGVRDVPRAFSKAETNEVRATSGTIEKRRSKRLRQVRKGEDRLERSCRVCL